MKTPRTTYLITCLLAGVLNTRSAEVLHYVLAPGSTITPCNGATPVGPTEALTGRLDWVLYQPPITDWINSFDAVKLDFRSASFALSLNKTTANDIMSVVHADSPLTVFDEVADVSGFGVTPAWLLSLDPGSYIGPPTRPTVLNYPNVGMGPVGGGIFAARLNLVVVMEGLVNVAPSFTKGPDVTVLQNCGAQVLNDWATDISAGPPNEAGQTVAFVLASDNPALFEVAPAISPDGTLTFKPAPSANGISSVTVVLQDNGGTAYGGQDTSAPQTFTIAVLSPCQAIELLIGSVKEADLGHINKRPLLASLEAACKSFQRGNWRSGVNQLRAFQIKVRVLVAPVYPSLAQQWVADAEAIISIFADNAGKAPEKLQPALPATKF